MQKRLFIILVLFCFSLAGERIYYRDGSFISMKRLQNVNAVKQDRFQSKSLSNPLLKWDLGSRQVLILENGKGNLPVYFINNYPIIADNYLFYNGTHSIEKLENVYQMKLVEIDTFYGLYKFHTSNDAVKTAQAIVEDNMGYAFPDTIRKKKLLNSIELPPKDTYYRFEWHLKNNGEYPDLSSSNDVATLIHADIWFEEAMTFLNDQGVELNKTTKLAIVDSGVVPDHPDLNLTDAGYDAIENKDGGYPDTSTIDDLSSYEIPALGHGTTCAGTAAAMANDIGVVGVCPWCGIYPVRFLKGVEGSAISESMYLEAFKRITEDSSIVAVNCSFGAQSTYGFVPLMPGEKESHEMYMKDGRNGLGGAIVYASGNENVDDEYYALHNHVFEIERNGETVEAEVITVGASTAWDTRARYSNFGVAIDVIAPSMSSRPAVGITTTTIPEYGDLGKDYTAQFSGTSAAAPVVTGALGVIFSVNPELTLEQAITILRKSADKINPDTGFYTQADDRYLSHSVKFGYGRLNLLKAVRLAAGSDMCETVTEEICDNHIDDNCDGFVDEGCLQPPTVGTLCTEDNDCITDIYNIDQVTCIKEMKGTLYTSGYCAITITDTPCPDGTFLYGRNKDNKLTCFKECDGTPESCGDESLYCSGANYGICIANCEVDEDCSKNYFCNNENICEHYPAEIGEPCETSDNCKNNSFCLGMLPNGYCMSQCKDGNDDYCPGDSACTFVYASQNETYELCLGRCSSNDDCRPDDNGQYVCHEIYGGKKDICFPQCDYDFECTDDGFCDEDGVCKLKLTSEEPDEAEILDEESVDTNETSEEAEETPDTETPKTDRKKDSGCSLIIL